MAMDINGEGNIIAIGGMGGSDSVRVVKQLIHVMSKFLNGTEQPGSKKGQI